MSGNINVGLLEGRNSSRVSKPPGGGHTQLFGSFDEDTPKPKTKQHNNMSNISEINACFTQQNAFEATKTKEILYKEDKEENSENDAPEQVDNKPAAQRVRVPPGGFSSGFW